jgi:hypothetical protein
MGDDEGKLFSLTEAERVRREIEPVLISAIVARRKLREIDEQLGEIAERIQRSGGLLVPYDKAARLRVEHNRVEDALREAVERIHSTGCIVKDLEAGLLDFPARIENEDVYYCWRLGEDRIRFYHRQDEGFAGRKPIDPHDAGHGSAIQ